MDGHAMLAPLLAVLLAQAEPVASPPPNAVPAPAEIVANVIDRSHGMHSFEAEIATNFRQRNFPFIHVNLTGRVYFQAPDRYVVTYQRIPPMMKGFPEAYAAILNVPAWPQTFDFAPGTSKTIDKHLDLGLHLTPKRTDTGTVSAEVYVNPETWAVDETDWVLKGNVHFGIAQSFATAGGYRVLTGQHFAVQVPYARADGDSTFTSYHMNVALDESLFPPR